MEDRAHKTYWGLLGLQGSVTFSDAVMPLALPWIAYDLSRSLPLMAVLYVVESLMPLAVSIGITPWVAPMRALWASQWSRAVMLAGVFALYSIGWHDGLWAWLFVTAGVIGTGSVRTRLEIRRSDASRSDRNAGDQAAAAGTLPDFADRKTRINPAHGRVAKT